MKNLILIEPEKDALEPVYFHLRDQIDTGTVLLDPTKKEIENYLNLESTSTVVKPLISQAPIQYIEIGSEYYFVPELEKIIVDMITEKSLFQGFQGKELHTIIQNLANRYTIKNSRLRRYSQRRNRWTEVQNIVEPYLNNKSSALHD